MTGMKANFADNTCLENLDCCDPIKPSNLGIAPSAALMGIGYFFPVPAICLVYGIVCIADKRHFAAWKNALGLKDSTKVAPQNVLARLGASSGARL